MKMKLITTVMSTLTIVTMAIAPANAIEPGNIFGSLGGSPLGGELQGITYQGDSDVPTQAGHYIKPSDCHGDPDPHDQWVPAHKSGCEGEYDVVTLIVNEDGSMDMISATLG